MKLWSTQIQYLNSHQSLKMTTDINENNNNDNSKVIELKQNEKLKQRKSDCLRKMQYQNLLIKAA